MGYYISPRFLDKIAVHITKNFLDLPQVRVPLILGIHGKKGEGKSFQCELIFQQMGIEVIHMSAGELESPDAGDPARLLRLRYREAAELIKVRGKMVVLMINDLDAGAGRFDTTTQYTVNTQLVNGTLMNIADNPTNVQLPGSYDPKPLHPVPILVTGNDFSTLYEPLIRDGRMEKFYWEPNREEKIGIVGGIFSKDELSRPEIEQLVDTFLNQPIDFYGALRARVYDQQVREFIHKIGIEKVSARVVNSKEPITFAKPNFNLDRLVEFGNLMKQEQEQIRQSRLVREYNRVLNTPSQTTPASMAPPTQFAQTQAPATPPKPVQTPQTQPTPHQGNGQISQLSPEILSQLQQLKTSGYRIGIEYVDQRRFRTNSWQSCGSFSAQQASQAKEAIESCIAEHQEDYVRLVGIDPQAKRRVVETIIHRPEN